MLNGRQSQELIDAVKAGDEDRVRSIVSIYPDLANTSAGDVPIVRLAVYHGHRAVAQALIDLGSDVDIYTAAALNKADRLAMLMRGGRDAINAHSADGWTPLALAAYFGAPAAARLLLAAGADHTLRSTNEAGNQPLHAATAGKQQDVIELLVESGADINAQDARGWTPLNIAAHDGPIATIRYLLAHGADPGIPNNEGRTPLQTAEHEGRDAAAEVLRG
jgi:ankyrin repeat protein